MPRLASPRRPDRCDSSRFKVRVESSGRQTPPCRLKPNPRASGALLRRTSRASDTAPLFRRRRSTLGRSGWHFRLDCIAAFVGIIVNRPLACTRRIPALDRASSTASQFRRRSQRATNDPSVFLKLINPQPPPEETFCDPSPAPVTADVVTDPRSNQLALVASVAVAAAAAASLPFRRAALLPPVGPPPVARSTATWCSGEP